MHALFDIRPSLTLDRAIHTSTRDQVSRVPDIDIPAITSDLAIHILLGHSYTRKTPGPLDSPNMAIHTLPEGSGSLSAP